MKLGFELQAKPTEDMMLSFKNIFPAVFRVHECPHTESQRTSSPVHFLINFWFQ